MAITPSTSQSHDHLEYLICILCGIQHQIISQLLHVFLDKTDDLSIKRISDDRIPEVFMIIDHNCDQLGNFSLFRTLSPSFLDISHFPDKILDLLNIGRRYLFLIFPCMTLETVVVLTPALCAISLIVAIIFPPEIFLCGSHCIGSV